MLETPFRVNLTTISLVSVQNLPEILILQMVMFIRSTSPAQLNVPLTSANKDFYFNYGNKSKATGLDKISWALLEGTDTWAHDIDRGKINAVVFLDLKKKLWIQSVTRSFHQN